jgi:hypothetical protein
MAPLDALIRISPLEVLNSEAPPTSFSVIPQCDIVLAIIAGEISSRMNEAITTEARKLKQLDQGIG